MPKHEDASKQRVKDQYRAQARAGAYDDLPEFRELVTSRRGFEPEPAIAALAHHNNNPKARGLMLAIKDLQPRWSPALAPLKTEADEYSGPMVIFVEPFGAGPEYFLKWCNEFRRLRWTPPEDWKDPVVASHGRPKAAAAEPAPKPSAEIDRAALIAKLKKKKPEGGDDGNGGEGDGQ